MNPLLITKYVTVAVLITIKILSFKEEISLKLINSKANEAKENTPSVSSSKYLIHYY